MSKPVSNTLSPEATALVRKDAYIDLKKKCFGQEGILSKITGVFTFLAGYSNASKQDRAAVALSEQITLIAGKTLATPEKALDSSEIEAFYDVFKARVDVLNSKATDKKTVAEYAVAVTSLIEEAGEAVINGTTDASIAN